MAIEIVVPRLGWSMEEGTFSGWLKQNGDRVSAGEQLFALESDKVTMDVESLDSGILYLPPDAPQAGAAVIVGQRLGYLLAPGELPPEEPLLLPELVVPATPNDAEPALASSAVPVPRRQLITPRARRVASELAVDTAALPGTGRNGRIREADVRAASPAETAPITTLRRTIATRMLDSHRNTAPVTLTTRADATALIAVRNQWTPAPSFADIIAKLAAMALESHPTLGGRWDGDRILLASRINIGIAVDTPQGLLVPVLRDVGATSLADLASRSRELVAAALGRRLRAEDVTGGTFTITNLGAFGVDAFTPIINYPETAVLGLGAIRKEPVVLHTGEIAARERMTLSLTFDHRVVDGAPAARFLQAVVRLIETPPLSVRFPAGISG